MERCGSKFMKIDEPIHFGGPSPGDQSTIAIEEDKMEEPETPQPVKPTVTDNVDPLGPARQSPTEETTLARKVIKEEIKTPEPAGETAMSAPTIVSQPRGNQ